MSTIKQSFPVTGMSCAACAVSVESILKSSEGVKAASVNFANQTAWASFDDELTDPLKLQKAVQSVGYDLIISSEEPLQLQEQLQLSYYRQLQRQTIWCAVLTVPVFLIGMFFMDIPYANWISMVLTIPVLFVFGRHFFIHAWKQLRHKQANMDTLVALSTGIAFLFSLFNTVYPEYWHRHGLHAHVYYETAAVIIVFISLGKLLEERAKAGTSAAIKKLLGLQPKTVWIVSEDGEHEISLADVKTGDVVLVRPGEKIAVDGSVVNGASYVDESMISGEPLAVYKQTNDQVFAGTINQKGSLQFRAEKVGSETMLAHIIRMVQDAQGSKAPVQKLVDKIAGIFVPVVIGIAVLTFFIWMMAGGENALTHALLTSVSVLVIACPCALGLATPTAIMVGVGKGAENNILIRDAESLEQAYRADTLVLDKTGTITTGKPAVTDLIWFGEPDNQLLQGILYSLEIRSEHPLASAITDKLKENTAGKISLDAFDSITARGVKGKYKQVTYFAGNRQLLEENNIIPEKGILDQANKLQQEAKTLVYFADEKEVLAVIAIADEVKKTSASAVSQLQGMGIEVYMLTGDNQETARAIAAQTGIMHYKAEMRPEEKSAFIRQLQQNGKTVAMAGDGINDSPALVQADLGIAMGKGSDIAMDIAKMTLITSDLRAIPNALKLSARTVRTIRQNLFWAFIYNLIGIPLAAGLLYPFNGFLLNPMIAGAAMALSSVSVVSNSLRLRYINFNKSYNGKPEI